MAYGDSCLSNGAVVDSGIEAMDRMDHSISRYADELESAQKKAKRAIEDAKDAQRRIDQAKGAISDAQDRAAGATLRYGAAEAKYVTSGLTGTPDAGAHAEREQASRDIDEAHAKERSARGALEQAEEDLREAQKRGEDAERSAREAAQVATGAFESVAAASPAAAVVGGPGRAVGGGGQAPQLLPLDQLDQGADQDGNPLAAGALGLASHALDAPGGASSAARHRATRLGRQLSTGQSRSPLARDLIGSNPPSAEVRSAAARALPEAGRSAKSISRFARPLGPVGLGVDLAANRAEGHGWGESAGRTAISGVTATGFGAAAGTACGALTLGLAAVACGAGGAVVGGVIGDKAGDFFFGD